MEKIISNINNSEYKNFYTQIEYNHYWEFYFNDLIVFKGINCNFCGNYIRLKNLNIKKYPENIYCKCFTNEWINNYKDIHNYYLEKVIKEYMNLIKSRQKLIKYALFYNKQKIYISEHDNKENKYIFEDKDLYDDNKENTLILSTSVSSFDYDLSSESSLDLSSLDSNYNSDSESYEYDPYNNLNIILESLIENTVEDFFKKS
jgi:hypothetical protein